MITLLLGTFVEERITGRLFSCTAPDDRMIGKLFLNVPLFSVALVSFRLGVFVADLIVGRSRLIFPKNFVLAKARRSRVRSSISLLR